jgi:hypothetical protein
MTDTTDNLTQRYRDVYENFLNNKQHNLRLDLPIVKNEQYDLFNSKKHAIKQYKNNHILDFKLDQVDSRPNFSKPKKLDLADMIGKAIVREQNQDLYEKQLLENQSRDIEVYMNTRYLDNTRIEKDLTDNVNSDVNLLEQPVVENNVSTRLPNRKTTLKEIEIKTSLPNTPFDDDILDNPLKSQQSSPLSPLKEIKPDKPLHKMNKKELSEYALSIGINPRDDNNYVKTMNVLLKEIKSKKK